MKILTLLILAAASLSCANQKAGVLVSRAAEEFATYQANANSKVEQAEAARLELELHLLRIDLANLYARGPVDPGMAQKTIDKVQEKIAARDARLKAWHDQQDQSGAIIGLALGAVTKYHDAGVSAEDLIPSINQLGTIPNILRKPEVTHVSPIE